jgi:hypothetical protein
MRSRTHPRLNPSPHAAFEAVASPRPRADRKRWSTEETRELQDLVNDQLHIPGAEKDCDWEVSGVWVVEVVVDTCVGGWVAGWGKRWVGIWVGEGATS